MFDLAKNDILFVTGPSVGSLHSLNILALTLIQISQFLLRTNIEKTIPLLC